MDVSKIGRRGLTASGVLLVGTVGALAFAAPAEAASSGKCTVSITAIGRGDSDQPYVHSKITCNNAKSVKLRTRMYVYNNGWTLYGNSNADQTHTWSSLDGSKTGSATNVREFCKSRGVVDGYFTKSGVTYSVQTIKDYSVC